MSQVNKTKIVPSWLQPFLWSVNVRDLDMAEDRDYIIHQILAYGNMRALRWLFRQYSKSSVKQVFLQHPMRIYRQPAYYFVKEVLLGIARPLKAYKYVQASLGDFKLSPAGDV